jgi:hypothetical protein
MVEKFGSDQQQLANSGGSVISQDSAVLINGDSDGEDALLFGPAALREIQSNVANGDFAIAPSDAEGVISEDNALPYWTGVQTGTAPTVSAAITTSAVTASQSALTFTVEAGAATNSAYTFTRYVPIAGNANRSSAYHPEVYSVTTTGGAGDKARVRITLTATAVDKDYAALTVTATANETASTLTSKSLFTNWIVPDAKAAYILVSVKVDVPATAPVGAVTVVIGEVRVARSEGSIAFPALQNPSGQPWIIENDNLIFEVYPQTELDPKITMESNASTSNYNINLSAANANGVIALSSGGYVDIAGIGNVDISSDGPVNIAAASGVIVTTDGTAEGSIYTANVISSGDLRLLADGGDVYLNSTAVGVGPRLLFRDSAGTFYGGLRMEGANVFRFYNGSTTNDYAYVYAERFYPMNGTTASRYIYDDGTRTHMTGGLDTDGSIVTTGSILNDSISTTTATANAAIWVLSSGTAYTLRRNSSSARYKTNIVDADEAVLVAARKIKPRHYESTIPDEAGATRLGFIAEEVEAAGLTHAVGYDAEGRVETLDPVALIAALFARVNDLEDRLKALESR